ncbi:aromatic ring-hydroxylating dioxygenase subunit alpha [Natronococcus sp. A-GB7]|uniref:aromatic ring-hydroxylating oxygenase subunit alpha n=1 Tax=Natronococcus sp. A-GB7 TaxID=3037649 RepID=UPI00241DF3DE|nr:aromatic ring-hydroxylating dioxygenase subunit alpha [Natronococcus sp. A-GB7]MDG5818613.1 aromatic ring-hydroxylating dioxygenase subunit alpha [Natronococcus sp. A-GB7]
MTQWDDSRAAAVSENVADESSTSSANQLADPDPFETEKETVFGEYWMYAGHANSIAEPGQFFTRTVGDRQLIVVRGHDGEIKAFDNVCAHRGSKMVEDTPMTDPGGGSRIQCPYHLWTYDLDGELRSTPKSFEDASLNPDLENEDVQEFDCETNGLNDVHVDSVGPLLFVSLSDDPPALSEQVGVMTDRLESLSLEGYEHGRRIAEEVECNWKTVAGAALERLRRGDRLAGLEPSDAALETADRHWLVRSTRDGGREAQVHYLWPNLTIEVYDDVDGYGTCRIDPIDGDRCQLIADYYVRDGDLEEKERERIRTSRRRRAELVELAGRRRDDHEASAQARLEPDDTVGSLHQLVTGGDADR